MGCTASQGRAPPAALTAVPPPVKAADSRDLTLSLRTMIVRGMALLMLTANHRSMCRLRPVLWTARRSWRWVWTAACWFLIHWGSRNTFPAENGVLQTDSRCTLPLFFTVLVFG